MSALVLELIPLGVASALIPLPIIVMVLLLRSPAGKAAGAAWIAGQAVARLAQGLLVALLLDRALGSSGDDATKGPVVATVLLVLGILFYVLAARKALHAPDDDDPPPGWLAALSSATPSRAFLMGAGLMAISVKFWVFTLGATSAISHASLDPVPAIAVYIGWTVLACSLQLALLLATVLAPSRAEALLARIGELLSRYSRPLLIAVGLIFGTVFLAEGLVGLGVL
jgi:threonine/homoserine/homoserine lactone efflux protein